VQYKSLINLFIMVTALSRPLIFYSKSSDSATLHHKNKIEIKHKVNRSKLRYRLHYHR
jgi:hypothetical protein